LSDSGLRDIRSRTTNGSGRSRQTSRHGLVVDASGRWLDHPLLLAAIAAAMLLVGVLLVR
jgi:hypothetical protein